MKILLVNKFYYRRGGDCIYTINLEKLLIERGHQVAVFAMQHPNNIPSEWSKYFPSEVSFTTGKEKLKSFFRLFGDNEVKAKFSALLSDFQPDIVHLNNIHSQLSPVVAQIAHNKGIKVVWTLHDYKLLCPRYDCMRNGKECSLCYSSKINVLRHKCMKNSLSASVLAYLEALKWNRKKLEKYTSTFICPSAFMRDEMLKGGFNSAKLTVLNNFINVENLKNPESTGREDYYCYIGRLSEEKGVETLLKAVSQLPYRLIVIGTGILENRLKAKYSSEKIVFTGYKTWEEIETVAAKARFIVVPSEWRENNPLSIIESLTLGTPVLGANIGGIPEMINLLGFQNLTGLGKCGNGMLFESRNIVDLKDKISALFSGKINYDYETIARNARVKYCPENHYNSIIKIYEK